MSICPVPIEKLKAPPSLPRRHFLTTLLRSSIEGVEDTNLVLDPSFFDTIPYTFWGSSPEALFKRFKLSSYSSVTNDSVEILEFGGEEHPLLVNDVVVEDVEVLLICPSMHNL